MPRFVLKVLITHSPPHPEGHAESLGHAQVLVHELGSSEENSVSAQSVFYTPPAPNAPATAEKEIKEHFEDIMDILKFPKLPAAGKDKTKPKIDTPKSYSVSYGYDRDAGTDLPAVTEKIKKKIAESSGARSVCITLYSDDVDKSLADFHEEINGVFSKRDFNIDTYNCADAVNYTLNYFLPRSKNLESFVADLEWKMPKLASTPLCILNLAVCGATCTTIPLKATSLFTTTPDDLLKKVKLLESFYGPDGPEPKDDKNFLDKSKGPQHQDPVWEGERPQWREEKEKEKEKTKTDEEEPAQQPKKR